MATETNHRPERMEGPSRSPRAAALALLLILILPACGPAGPTVVGRPTSATTVAPLLATVPYECSQDFQRHELAQPYQTTQGSKRYTLSQAEWQDYLAVMGVESGCVAEALGAPFTNADWRVGEGATAGRMLSLGFEALYHGAGWSDAYLVYATYDFSGGTEYDVFATVDDYRAVQAGTMPDTVEVAGATAFVRFGGSALCMGRCNVHRSIVFPFADHYVAVVSNVGAYDAAAGWNDLLPPLLAGVYPEDCRGYVSMMDWLAASLRFRGEQ